MLRSRAKRTDGMKAEDRTSLCAVKARGDRALRSQELVKGDRAGCARDQPGGSATGGETNRQDSTSRNWHEKTVCVHRATLQYMVMKSGSTRPPPVEGELAETVAQGLELGRVACSQNLFSALGRELPEGVKGAA